MNIQSLSIVVPANHCINNCKFCVSKMHHENYSTNLTKEALEKEYFNRMAFARDNGCNTMMITGTTEPQQNLSFLRALGRWNRELDKPFRWIEMQTSGTGISDSMLKTFKNDIGISTISLSLSSLDPYWNREYTGAPRELDIKGFCEKIKEYGFNLRISLNLTDKAFYGFNDHSEPARNIDELCLYCKNTLKADQITFRVLYYGQYDCPENTWIKEHRDNLYSNYLRAYIKEKGRKLERLEFGQIRYDLYGLSVVIDDDCMSQEIKESLKYLVLRPNGKLYSKWDSEASLIF